MIKLAHERPNSNNEGANCMVINGYGFAARENIAWHYTISGGISAWASERKYYHNNDTSHSMGHYRQLIDPRNTYMGLSSFTYKTDEAGNSSTGPNWHAITFEASSTPQSGSLYPTHIYSSSISEYKKNTSGYTMTEEPRETSGEASQTVEVAAAKVQKVVLDKDQQTMTVCPGKTATITPKAEIKLESELGSDYDCTSTWKVTKGAQFTSSKVDVATVDSTGKVTAVKEGTATITVTVGNQTATVKLNVAHSWNEGEVTKKATCKTKGEKTFKCSRCGDTKTEETDLDPSNHENIVTKNKKDATCTEDGYTGDKVCEACHTTITTGEIIQAKGHSFGEWVHTGSHTHTCKDCQYSETEECTFGDWKVTKNPTATEKGVKERVCTKCGFKEAEDIPVTGNSGSQNNGGTQNSTGQNNGSTGTNANNNAGSTGSKTNTTVNATDQTKTGDNSHVAFWLSMAGAGMIALWFAARRKRQNSQ